MQLIEILREKSREELKNFARINGISGFAGLKKDDLITLIMTAVIDKEQFKEIFTHLSPSAKWILMLLVIDFDGIAPIDSLKTAVKEQYTRRTFRKAIGTLLDSPFFGLEFNEMDQEIGVIPRDIKAELQPLVEQYSKGRRKSEEKAPIQIELTPEEIEAEAEEKEEIKEVELNIPDKLRPIAELMNYTDKKTLKFYCEGHDLVKGGKHDQLVERILNSNPQIEELLDVLFLTPKLQIIAKELGLPKMKDKKEIIKAIMKKFGIESMKETIIAKADQAEKVEIEPKVVVKEVQEKDAILSQQDLLKERIDEILEDLNRSKRPKPRDEKEFQFFMLGYLYGKYGTGHRNVTYEKVSQGQRLDITLWGKIIIETKVTASKKEVKDGLGQLIDYLEQNKQYSYGILAVYDESTERNLNSQFSHIYAEKIFVEFFT